MNFEPQDAPDGAPGYGSSEYSAEAEKLFARYLLARDSGEADDFEADDFEAFCAEHPDQEDELFGLHADWDNVRGLLGKLEAERAGAAPPAPAAEGAPAAEEPPTEPEPVAPAPTAGARAWKLGAAAATLAAIGLGLWATDLLSDSRVLAAEKKDLADEGSRVSAELATSREEGRRLTAAKTALESDLDDTARQRDTALEESRGLADRLQREAEARRTLDEQRERLAAELEEERKKEARTHRELLRTRAKAELLATGELLRREATLWPTVPARARHIEGWLAEVEALATGLRETRAGLAASEDDLDRARAEALGTAIEPLLGAEGLATRTRGRLERLRAWRARLADEDAEAWAEVLAALAEPAAGEVTWTPQCGLLPLGRGADGLWLFADLQTGAAPTPDDPGEGDALLFALVPGLELEGRVVPAFLVALEPWSNAHRAHALGDLSAPANASERAVDWARLGYRGLTPIQEQLARGAGLRLKELGLHPSRPLVLPGAREEPQASFGE